MERNEPANDPGSLYTPNVRPRRVMVSGEGVWMLDEHGERYLDFIAGIGVNLYGHGHPAILAAIRRQAGALIHHSNLYASPAPLGLARALVGLSFADRVFFTNSGAEAVEAGIKLVRSYFRRVRREDRFEIVALERGFHGRTMGALSCTGIPRHRKGFEPVMGGVVHVPFGDLDALRAAVGPRTAAILLEPIQGGGGVRALPEGYLRAAREMADEAGCLLFLDEVQTGCGRTGAMFAYEHEGVVPDVMALAKGLGGGLPLGALLTTEQVAQGFGPGTHGTTMGGNPVACAAGLAGLELLRGGLLDRSREAAALLWSRLEALASEHGSITGVRGRGLMIGVELKVRAKAVEERCLDHGLLVNTAGKHVLRMLPPLVIEPEHVEQAVDVLGRCLSEAHG